MSISAVELVLADPADVPTLAAMSQATFGADGLPEAALRRYLGRAHAAILSLRRGPEIVSYSVAEFNRRQRRVYVVETCTRPDERAAGHALRLRALLEQLARRLGYASIASHVRISNHAARRLNERAGMERVGRIADYYDDGEAADYFRRALWPRAVPPARTLELLELRRSSRRGRGVFARREIAAGEPLLTLGGRLVVADQVAGMPVGPRLWLVPAADDRSLQDFINHGREANTGFADGSVTLRALRPIRAGQELLTWAPPLTAARSS